MASGRGWAAGLQLLGSGSRARERIGEPAVARQVLTREQGAAQLRPTRRYYHHHCCSRTQQPRAVACPWVEAMAGPGDPGEASMSILQRLLANAALRDEAGRLRGPEPRTGPLRSGVSEGNCGGSQPSAHGSPVSQECRGVLERPWGWAESPACSGELQRGRASLVLGVDLSPRAGSQELPKAVNMTPGPQ